jgi:hypothetical protein
LYGSHYKKSSKKPGIKEGLSKRCANVREKAVIIYGFNFFISFGLLTTQGVFLDKKKPLVAQRFIYYALYY